MSRRKSRKRPRLKAERKAYRNQGLGLGLLLLVVAIGVWLWWTRGEALRKLDLCDNGRGELLGEAIIIVDASDSWSLLRQQVVRNELIESVGIHRNVSVYPVQSGLTAATQPEPTITLCNPGSWDLYQETYGNPLGAQQDLLDDRYQTFRDSILKAVDAIAAGPSFDNSPIMETLQWVAEIAAEKASDYPENLEIFLISDLLQNSSEYSVYGGNPDLSSTMAGALAGLGVLGARGLEDAEVSLFMLLNLPYPPGVTQSSLVGFWETYAQEQGASIALIKPMQ